MSSTGISRADFLLFIWLLAGAVAINFPLEISLPLSWIYPNFHNDIVAVSANQDFVARFSAAIPSMFLLYFVAAFGLILAALLSAGQEISGSDAFRRFFYGQAATLPFNAAFVRPSMFADLTYGNSSSFLVLPAHEISLYIMLVALAIQLYGIFWSVVFVKNTMARQLWGK